jgi:hypothetical protein
MLRKLLMFFVTSGLAAKAMQRLGERRRSRGRAMDRRAEQRWDNEGGMPR